MMTTLIILILLTSGAIILGLAISGWNRLSGLRVLRTFKDEKK